ncbi:MAG: large conductance mechanosensitive channel protein MscL [Vampirovibrionales bacterium]|nr:large conductance mechanosensitive channel protein MscL [Vampirovibrionales bacterium]
MWKDFKQFLQRGNVLDLAVGVIIGASFGKITQSLVDDIIMPPIGLLLGKVDFANLYFSLTGGTFSTLAEAQKAGAVTINYGLFINALVNFLIVAFAVFMLVRQVNRLMTKPVEATPTTKPCPFCCSPIPIEAKRCPQCTSEV